MAIAIDLNNLSKRYPGAKSYALSGVSLQVNSGEVYGFLGANGAGKSTTIRTLLNFIQPTGGSATIYGLDIVKDSVEAKKHIGYLAGDVALYDKMTGREFLSYMSDLQPAYSKKYLIELIKRFQAEPDKRLGELSKGNRQKFGIIQAFMHQPEVLILDEPTSGLDPLMQEEFFALITETKQRDASVFVSSHNFAEVQRMCDRVGFIRNGKLVAEQSLAELASRAAHTFELTFSEKAPIDVIKKIPNANISYSDKYHITISIEGDLSPLFRVLGRHSVVRLQQKEVNLEEEFMHFYEESGSE